MTQSPAELLFTSPQEASFDPQWTQRARSLRSNVSLAFSMSAFGGMFANFAFASLLHPAQFAPQEPLFYFYLAGHFISFSLFAPAIYFARKASQLAANPAALLQLESDSLTT